MKEIIVGANEANQTLYKLLSKYLKNASSGFIYKMLRKKNITLNDRKSDGKDILNEKDSIKLWLAEDTLNKFINNALDIETDTKNNKSKYEISDMIVFEDKDIIILNKPSGLLSQKAEKDDVSINELCISYLLEKKELSKESLCTFKPSICNRLDRNTSGLIIFGKTLVGSRNMNFAIKNRHIEKFYLAIVHGNIVEASNIKAYVYKDEKNNKIIVKNNEFNDSKYIETEYKPLYSDGKISLLLIKLITGRTHQIRAHLAFIGHPIVGDTKYGNLKNNKEYMKLEIKNQLLHSYALCNLENISGGCIFVLPPPEFRSVLKGYSWELGKPEDLGAQI